MLDQIANSAVFAASAHGPESTPHPTDVVTVLCVSPLEDDHLALSSIFAHSNWRLCLARNCHDAFNYLKGQVTPVIISESNLDGQCWKQVLGRIRHLPPPQPRLIVASRLADDNLWSEVLNLGGYNVLEKPFDNREVYWVVSHAWLDWKSEWDREVGHSWPQLVKTAGF